MNIAKKIISVAVIGCFLLSFVFQQSVYAVVESYNDGNKAKYSLDGFVLPYSYGQITDSYFASSDRIIINIQDLHCHAGAQKNISSIIEVFDGEYGIQNIYLEGAYGNVDTQWIVDAVGNTAPGAGIMDKMLETGRLTGAEYYSAFTKKTDIIKGLEKKDAYLENLSRLSRILESKNDTEAILKEIDNSVKELKGKYYDKRQFKIEKLFDDYSKSKISVEKYYSLLLKHVDRLAIDIYRYDNTVKYINLLSVQKRLNYAKIADELQKVTSFIKDVIPYNSYKNLLNDTDNFSRMDRLYIEISKITKENGIDIRRSYPELSRYFRYIELTSDINPLELVKEERFLVNEINTRFAASQTQKEIVFIAHFQQYLANYLTNKITSDEYEYYLANISDYKELWNKHLDSRLLSLLEKHISEADNFYRINSERNMFFAENLFDGSGHGFIGSDMPGQNALVKLINSMNFAKKIDIIITGGFHTEGISKILKDSNISYIVVTPKVSDGLRLAEETYNKIIKEQAAIGFQTLANMVSSLTLDGQIKTLHYSGFDIKDISAIYKMSENEILRIIYESEISESGNSLSLELTDLIRASKILDHDDDGDIFLRLSEILKESVSDQSLQNHITADLIKSYVDIEMLEKAFYTGNIDGIMHTSVLKANIAQEETSLGKSLELYVSFAAKVKNTVKNFLTSENSYIINCAADCAGRVLNISARHDKAALALKMIAADIASGAYYANNYYDFSQARISMHAMREILNEELSGKSGIYNGYITGREGLRQALLSGAPLIAGVSSLGFNGITDHFITLTPAENNYVILQDGTIAQSYRLTYDELFDMLSEKYGWQNGYGNILTSAAIDSGDFAKLSPDMMMKISGTGNSFVTERRILKLLGAVMFDYPGYVTREGILNDREYENIIRALNSELLKSRVTSENIRKYTEYAVKAGKKHYIEIADFLLTRMADEKVELLPYYEKVLLPFIISYLNNPSVKDIEKHRMMKLISAVLFDNNDYMNNPEPLSETLYEFILSTLESGNLNYKLSASNLRKYAGIYAGYDYSPQAEKIAELVSYGRNTNITKKPNLIKLINEIGENENHESIMKLIGAVIFNDPVILTGNMSLDDLEYMYIFSELKIPEMLDRLSRENLIRYAEMAASEKNYYTDIIVDEVLRVREEIEELVLENFDDSPGITEKLKNIVYNDKPATICFICSANMNRSASAHVIFEYFLRKNGNQNVKVQSAGVFEDYTGAPFVYKDFIKNAINEDVDNDIIENFRSEIFSLKHSGSDYFIVVGEEHRRELIRKGIDAGKIITFADLAPEFSERMYDGEMPDPSSGQITHNGMLEMIRDIINTVFKDSLVEKNAVEELPAAQPEVLPSGDRQTIYDNKTQTSFLRRMFQWLTVRRRIANPNLATDEQKSAASKGADAVLETARTATRSAGFVKRLFAITEDFAKANTKWNNGELKGLLKNVNLEEEIAATGLSDSFIKMAQNNSLGFISVYDFYKQASAQNRKKGGKRKYKDTNDQVNDSLGFAFGLSSYDSNGKSLDIVKSLADPAYGLNMANWFNGYRRFFSSGQPTNEEYLEAVVDYTNTYTDKKIFFFLPKNIFGYSQEAIDEQQRKYFEEHPEESVFAQSGGGITKDEINWLMNHPQHMRNVQFIVGAYDFIDTAEMTFDVYKKYFTAKKLPSTLVRLLADADEFMQAADTVVQTKEETAETENEGVRAQKYAFLDRIKVFANAVKDIVNIIPLITKAALQIVLSDIFDRGVRLNEYDIKSKLVVVDTKEEAHNLKKLGFNAAVFKIAAGRKELMNAKKIGTILKYKGSAVRAYWNQVSGEVVFYSKSGLDGIEEGVLKEGFKKMRAEGLKDDVFKGVSQVIVAESGRGLQKVVEAIVNESIDSAWRPGIDLNLDIRENKADFSRLCSQEYSNGIMTLIINAGQAKQNRKTIEKFQALGMKFMLGSSDLYEIGSAEDFKTMTEELKSDGIYLNGIILSLGNINKNDLLLLRDMTLNNIRGTEIIETKMYAQGLDEKLLSGDIYGEYDVIPVLNAEDALAYAGSSNKKSAVMLSGNENIEDIAISRHLLSVIGDKEKIEKVVKSKTVLDSIKDVFKASTPQQLFEAEVKAVRNSDQKFETGNLRNFLNDKDGSLINILINSEVLLEGPNFNEAASALDALLEERGLLTGLTRARVIYLKEKGKFAEALGCVRAAAMNTAERMINEAKRRGEFDFDSYKKYMNGQLRDAEAINALQLLMAGKDLSELAADTEIFESADLSAKDYIDSKIIEINKYIRFVLKENRLSIKPLAETEDLRQENSVQMAVNMFKAFDIVIFDRFRKIKISKQVRISTLEVQKILSAA